MRDAGYIDVEPLSCIPFVNIRNTTESAVVRFVFVFSGRSASALGPEASGILCASDTDVVLKLESSQNKVILTYLKSQSRKQF